MANTSAKAITAKVPKVLTDYIKAYRDTLQPQLNATLGGLAQERANAQTSIMSNASRQGMLHSNFTARDKLKYDTGTYEPAVISAQQTYQSGLDTLRSNTADIANTVKSLQEKIADLNYQRSQLGS